MSAIGPRYAKPTEGPKFEPVPRARAPRSNAPGVPALISSRTTMTILELTQLLSGQDDRWAAILTRAQGTKNPATKAGIDFFRKTWRLFMGSYYENVAARYDSAAEAPPRIVRWVLDTMADVIFPAARRAGFSEQSFVIPDITIEPPGDPMIAGSVASRGDEVGVGTKIAFAALAFAGVGLAVYIRDLNRIACTA